MPVAETVYRVRPGYTIHLPFKRMLRGGELLVNPSPELVKNNAWKLENLRSVTTPPTDIAERQKWEEEIHRQWEAETAKAATGEPGSQRPLVDLTLTSNGAWQGRRCFIIGGGPSLAGFDFSQLRGELVIGINRAFEKIAPSVIFSMDSRLYAWIKSGMLGQEALDKYEKSTARKIWVEAPSFKFGAEVLVIPRLEGVGIGRSLSGGLYTGSNSGLAALNLAVVLGANPIYLLGFDLISRDQFQQWWHDGYPTVQRDKVYQTFRKEFEEVAPTLKEMGVSVINLNPESGLRCFDFGKMPEPPQPIEDKVTVVTPTGDRPEALELLRRWIASQTRQPDQWLVVDDGKHRIKPKRVPEATVVRRKPRADDPSCTLGKNLEAILPLVAHDKVLIMEDDDWYGPEYIDTMAALLDAHEVVGISGTKYYHPGIPGYREMGRGDHASLSQTGFRKSAIPEVLKAIPFDANMPAFPECSVDMRLWKNCNGQGHLVPGADMKLHCSIKGLPGRPGAGVGHDKRYYTPDKDLTKFREWCGDVEAYRGFIKV
jgi:hypothetical protein